MGAVENAEVVRRGYEAFNKADIATLTEIMDENTSWHTPGRSPIAGHYQGRDAVFAQFGRYGGDTGGTFKAELKQYSGLLSLTALRRALFSSRNPLRASICDSRCNTSTWRTGLMM